MFSRIPLSCHVDERKAGEDRETNENCAENLTAVFKYPTFSVSQNDWH